MKLQKIKSMCMVGLVLCIAACTSKNTNEVAETETRISDDSLFTLVQYKTFQYFWDGAEPVSGGARERFHSDNIYPQNDKHIITSGGTGFGVMAILVGIERKFITREQGVEHLEKLEKLLRSCSCPIVILKGGLGKKKRQEAMKELSAMRDLDNLPRKYKISFSYT